jgi:hypothetical protein
MGRTASPLIPIFAAIDDLHKGQYEYTKLDLVTDRNNLRKLLRWATGDGDTFRIDIERAGQTCLFTRCEEKDSEHVIGFKGFGHEYEKAATRFAPGCEKATGHHRIISIVRQCLSPFDWLASDSPPTKNFGGLKILLRFEVDACMGSSDFDDLASAFSGLDVTPAIPLSTGTSSVMPGISVIHTTPRTLVAQSSLIELKTRASHRPLDWTETYPQLYLSQTAYLYLAKHTKGNFGAVEKIKLAGDSMKVYAKQAEGGMVKLKAVLDQVLEVVRKESDGVGLSLVSVGGKLMLYKRKEGTGKAVGDDILSRFA